MIYICISILVLLTTSLHMEKGAHSAVGQMHELKDGPNHEVAWGHYNSNSAPDTTQPNWMSRLPDDIRASQVSIPGTHDSGTFSCSRWQACDSSQCQSWNIYNQLSAGIRYLDLRIDIRSDYLAIGHGDFQFMALRDALDHVARFLNENPSEFVILAYQVNRGSGDPSDRIIQTMANSGITAYFGGIPVVGFLRRKAWVFNGLGVEFPNNPTYIMRGVEGIVDNEQIYLQNMYQVYIWNIGEKVNKVKHAAFNVPCTDTRMKVNFLSGSGGVMPYWLAKWDDKPN